MRKRQERHTRHIVRNLAAVFVTGVTDKVQCVHLPTRRRVSIDGSLAQAIADTPFQWSVHICALCRAPDGKEYVKGITHYFKVRYRQSNLTHHLNESHQKFLKESIPKDQLLAAAWLASPLGRDMDNEMAFEIFKKMGAFEILESSKIC